MKILLFINTLYITLVFVLVIILLTIGYWVSIRRNIAIYKKKAINILKRENLYRTLFDNTGTCTLLIDKDLIILLSNSEFEKLSGYSRSETDSIINLKDLVHISDSKKFYDYANHIFSDEKNTEKQTELRITSKFGEEKHCICKLTPIKGFNQCIVSLADITINKSNEQMLIESREQYKAFLNAIPNLIFNIDEKGRIIDSQDFRDRTFNFFETHPLKAVFIHELFRAEVATDIIFHKDIAINSNKTTQLDFCLSDNNKLLFFEAQFVPIGAKQLLFIIHDITERIEKDRTIKILGHAVKEVSECVNITDENNIIQYVNKAFLKTYGYTETEVIGKNVNLIVSKNNSDKLLDDIKEARLKGFWQGELLNIRKNKKEFPVYLSTSLLNSSHKCNFLFNQI
ncbi:MAG: PAS domain S-box protein [Bacteroidetes bacterium]|nr:PAS domain S-box protein [Bacteroidota bacterium]